MRIGFMGGSYNPPHTGHLNAARVFYEQQKLDKLLIIPAKVSPFKTDKKCDASDEQRLEMCKKCFSTLQDDLGYNIEVSTIELDSDSISYTYLTIRTLLALYEGHELIMYVGSDMFFTLDKWKNPDEIFSSCKIYTICRDVGQMSDMLKAKDKYCKLFNANIVISNEKEVIVSSTDVRKEIYLKNYSNCEKLLTDEVLRYIIINRLYFQENHEE
ncbi:MAG: nicotinate (nicotinamide) nucleotide adenylyltransferase [Clostridia bacterium]|nr:nicotinate (nicotinamide) nucleotide adenylyltransferase [Clostridia bacterium]